LILLFLEECANGNKHAQGQKNGPRIHNEKGTNNSIMPSGNVNESFDRKQVFIYLLRIWIVDGIPQISASCAYLEVMDIKPNVH